MAITRINPAIRAGRLSGSQVPSGEYIDRPITYSGFGSTPRVVACIESSATSSDIGSMTASPIDITATGCTIRVFNNSQSARSPAIQWIAVEA